LKWDEKVKGACLIDGRFVPSLARGDRARHRAVSDSTLWKIERNTILATYHCAGSRSLLSNHDLYADKYS